MSRVLKVTISGSYHAGKDRIIDFNNVVGHIPYCDERDVLSHVRRRFAAKWVSEDGRYTDRVNKIREVFVDDVLEMQGELSYVGKDLRTLNADELQELAVSKSLMSIPAPRMGSLRNALNVAYCAYVNNVLDGDLSHNAEGFKLMEQPPIYLKDGYAPDVTVKLTNEQVISGEQTDTPQLDMAKLKEIAKSKGIEFHPSISYDKLYARVFPKV